MLLILSPALPAIFTACLVWKSALRGCVLRPNRPGCLLDRSLGTFSYESCIISFRLTILVYPVFFILSQASHASSTMK